MLIPSEEKKKLLEEPTNKDRKTVAMQYKIGYSKNGNRT